MILVVSTKTNTKKMNIVVQIIYVHYVLIAPVTLFSGIVKLEQMFVLSLSERCISFVMYVNVKRVSSQYLMYKYFVIIY